MLIRRIAAGVVAMVLGFVTSWQAQASPQTGGGKVVCDKAGFCRVVADDSTTGPGNARNGDQTSHGSSKPKCFDSNMVDNAEVPCTLRGLGSWVSGSNCYFQKAVPQPSAGDPQWEGHEPSDGAVYSAYCPDNPNMTSQWFAQDPAGADVAVDPEALAREAVRKMRLRGPDIASPKEARTYTVGVPVWMWVRQGPTTYGPESASASAGGVTVTATAEVSRIVWAMGDGTSVTCRGPGTVYQAADGMSESPTCGHVYSKTSADSPNDRYTLSAVATWQIDWRISAGGVGQSGQLSQTQQSQMQVAIGEVQVVR